MTGSPIHNNTDTPPEGPHDVYDILQSLQPPKAETIIMTPHDAVFLARALRDLLKLVQA